MICKKINKVILLLSFIDSVIQVFAGPLLLAHALWKVLSAVGCSGEDDRLGSFFYVVCSLVSFNR